MENRTLIALALSFLVFLVFMYIGEKTRVPQVPPGPLTQQPQPASPPPPSAPAPAVTAPAPPAAAPPPAASARPARDIVVETPRFKAVFTEAGGCLKSFQLKKYLESLPFIPVSSFKLGPIGFELDLYHSPENSRAKLKELVRSGHTHNYPLALDWEGQGLQIAGNSLFYGAAPLHLDLKDGGQGTLKFTGTSPEGLTFVKTYTFKADSYSFDLAVQVINHTGKALEGQVGLDLSENFMDEESSRFHFLGFNGSINNRWEEIKSGALKEPQTFTGTIDWAGLDEGYFLTAMVPTAAPKSILTLSEPLNLLTKKLAGPMVARLRTSVENLPAGQEARLAYGLYFGPKELKDLKSLGLERAVNFGWFDFLGKPLLRVLNFFERYSFNYGWAIIILTFLIRIVFFYPNHKSYKSMKDMQKLQPKVAKIREKYKDDKEAMNKELMALYRTFKVNPLAGCLPMLLQLPVFIALYNVLGYSIELRHASFIPTLPFTNFVWLADLSHKDPLLITPVVMGATMFVQQKMTPTAGDPTQAKMMMFLPLVFTFMFLNFASGLVIYWLVNNVLSIIQQYYTNKYLT
jgi:YidC/Oxa1 family membrane protein insertase